jgi:phospho-N-acetylmuramoyl-pentapeptide-transferase
MALSNATNLADGLDGLSAGMSSIAFVALGATSVALGATRPVCLPAFLLAGACAGLLWFSVNPALVFMGNTGALALGAGLAGTGVLWKVEAPLLMAAAMFWAEALSVVAQVAVFKWRKRRSGIEYARSHRLFKRAPLHHHFEEIGWPETRIVGRFWLLSGVAAALAIAWAQSGLV